MFCTQAFDIWIRMADNQYHGSQPIPLEFRMDEFYAGAKPTDPDVSLEVVRSRNICMLPVLQSVRIKTLFKNDKWKTMLDNCATLLYLGSGSGELSLHKYISELMESDEVRCFKRGQCIIFLGRKCYLVGEKACLFIPKNTYMRSS